MANTPQQLMKSYAGLLPFEKDVLELISVFYMPVRVGTLVDVLRKRGARDDKGRVITGELLKPVLARLAKLKLIALSGTIATCERSVVERITRNMISEGRFAATEPLVRAPIAYQEGWSRSIEFNTADHVVANVRLPLYARDFDRLDQVGGDIARAQRIPRLPWHPLTSIIYNPFDPDWLDTYPPEQLGFWLYTLLNDLTTAGLPADEVAAFARARAGTFSQQYQRTLNYYLADNAFFRGDFAEMLELARDLGVYGDLLRARRLTVTGAAEDAVALYDACLAAFRQETRKRKPKFPTSDWAFFILALLRSRPANWARARELAEWGAFDKDFGFNAVSRELGAVIGREAGESIKRSGHLWHHGSWRHEPSLCGKLVSLLTSVWMELKPVDREGDEIAALCEKAAANGYHWIEMEFAAILEDGGHRKSHYEKRATALAESMGAHSLLDTIRPLEAWERTLNALLQVTAPETKAATSTSDSRLVWFLSEYRGHWSVEPKEQKLSAKGIWSKGRSVSLSRLANSEDAIDFLLPQDRAVLKHIHSDFEQGYWGRGTQVYFFSEDVIHALAGHPHVFMAGTERQIEVTAAVPELQVTATAKGFQIQITPDKPDSRTIRVERAGDTRIVVYSYTPEICRIAEILGKGLKVPARAKDEVLQAVRNVATMVTVHSDIGIGDESVPRVEADATPVVQLLPSGEGLLVHLRVRPLPDGGPVFVPATGGEVVIADVNGARLQAARDFARENEASAHVIASCATLATTESDHHEWRLETPDEALEFLMELEACTPAPRIEWPKGQKYAIQGQAGFGQFRAQINGGHNWFEVSGEVKVDQELVLDMQRLLELTSGTTSRFVALAEGQFLALTQAFRRKLDELRGIAELNNGALRMHSLAAPLMDDLLEQAAAVKANKKWKDQSQRLQRARDLDPEIPATLRAELREYQVAGFQWLARLATWGVGACLADDMGLGKTVQLLALILRRAADGPQLVVAPTSVCANWVEEAARFAPTLNVHRLGTGKREETLAGLGPYDLLVTSYGLLQTEQARLKDITWQTIVLDEAQAIKNMATKRSKAAMALDGEFKVVATGTPIENHLGEIWNLFQFINPGFLGSLEKFNARFATPIEKYQDRDASRRLKQLVQPFILRRRKADVLNELPARTDIVLHVELGEKERAFYEALRLRALKQLSDVKAAPGKHHVRILAEIMRLRRACCNTRLVDENSALPSAKLEVFEALLDELMENRHQALVFSQFVDHLAILRALLDRKGVAYQYLDGSTPAPARKKAVDAFQAGQGDVFLISLKAGGLGLNLTAADYVIHMDPWWNPAVEDQASDRAHRIGQQRPVTVYRLVAQSTIEDQITELHHRKRDLANNLLEGADIAGKISSEELLALLREG